MLQYFSTTVNHAISHGLTSIHDADAPPLYMKFFKGYVQSISRRGPSLRALRLTVFLRRELSL